ncbi:hypothetical protein BVAVS116_H0005 (plasmid) [Borreliella valaisiana VS116]|uniref:Uncharacterized protein n=1 Tax=Borreliella valaisiana VS116 TaxID=445987 RepID=C0R962_BORVA|nr:hypothetical protein BVAVS116_H0005 [Borreliella valaisiana VS116]
MINLFYFIKTYYKYFKYFKKILYNFKVFKSSKQHILIIYS